mgnify:CR=1 FL=1
MRPWPGSALRAAESLLTEAAARRMAKRRAAVAAIDASEFEEEELDATMEAAHAPPPVRIPILDVLGTDELRLVVEALLRGAPDPNDDMHATHQLRCCARAFRNLITNDDVTRYVIKLNLGQPYRARRAGFGKAFPSAQFERANSKDADLPRQVFVGRRPRPTGVTRFSQREAPYELEVMPPEGSDELRYINPIIVLDRSTGRYTEVVLLMDRRGLLSEIFPKW